MIEGGRKENLGRAFEGEQELCRYVKELVGGRTASLNQRILDCLLISPKGERQ